MKFTARMEEKLDTVEEGKTAWKDVIRDFYGGFERDLENAEKALEGVRLKVPDEVSEEKCDVCGRNMVIKSGRFGRFLACPGYPECTFTKPLVIEMPGRCPKCGGRMMKHWREQEDEQAVHVLCLRILHQQRSREEVRLHDLGCADEGRLLRVRPDDVQKRRARALSARTASTPRVRALCRKTSAAM